MSNALLMTRQQGAAIFTESLDRLFGNIHGGTSSFESNCFCLNFLLQRYYFFICLVFTLPTSLFRRKVVRGRLQPRMTGMGMVLLGMDSSKKHDIIL